MNSRLAVVLAVIFTAGGAPALAQQVNPEQAIRFLDKDGDGKCSLNEYLTFQAGRLAQFDANGDGKLQYAEFRESLQPRAKVNARRTFDAFDVEEERNALTRREFLGYHAYVFNNYVDADRDGFMSGEEWSKVVAQN